LTLLLCRKVISFHVRWRLQPRCYPERMWNPGWKSMCQFEWTHSRGRGNMSIQTKTQVWQRFIPLVVRSHRGDRTSQDLPICPFSWIRLRVVYRRKEILSTH
jgi:hypothetical protein